MREFLKTIVLSVWGFFTTLVGMIWSVLKGIWSATTWPARWIAAKAGASRIGLWLWSLSVDPPKMPLVYAMLFVITLPVIGVGVDRAFVRGDLIEQNMRLEGRLASVGQLNIACVAEKNAWESRALVAEDKYANLMKREPLPEINVVTPAAAPAAPVVKKRTPKKKTSSKPANWPDWLPY